MRGGRGLAYKLCGHGYNGLASWRMARLARWSHLSHRNSCFSLLERGSEGDRHYDSLGFDFVGVVPCVNGQRPEVGKGVFVRHVYSAVRWLLVVFRYAAVVR